MTEDEVDAGAEALRQLEQGGRLLRAWADLPNAAKRKWRVKAEAVMRVVMTECPTTVYCVMCIEDDGDQCTVHIFSTPEKQQTYAWTDMRPHVLYDYLVDHPEQLEQRRQ